MKTIQKYMVCMMAALLLGACDGELEADYPQDIEKERVEKRGKITGDGLTLIGRSESEQGGGSSPIGVNSFLWRATLDTVSFLPLVSADPFGGVVITDWYEDPATPGERFKMNVLIQDRSLRADGLKVSLFRQQRDASGGWRDAAANADTARQIEDTILTRARELRVQQSAR